MRTAAGAHVRAGEQSPTANLALIQHRADRGYGPP